MNLLAARHVAAFTGAAAPQPGLFPELPHSVAREKNDDQVYGKIKIVHPGFRIPDIIPDNLEDNTT